MFPIQYNKEQLTDFSFSKEREIILTGNAGSYCSTSLSTCNTRKYHGLFATIQPQMDNNFYMLLSSLDETILKGDIEYKLAVHLYPNTLYPEGHLFMENFSYDKAPEWNFIMDGIKISKQIILCKDENRLLIKYKVIEADTQFKIRFQPFLAFRNVHAVRQADFSINSKATLINNGIEICLYKEFAPLFMQFSKRVEFVASPDWYYDIEYVKEMERGYDFKESLFVPGYFEAALKKGDELIFSAGLTEIRTASLKIKFAKELQANISLDSFENCLINAAKQFIITHDGKTEVMAGWHWFGRWGRDTFISLPGLMLAQDNIKIFKSALDTILKDLNHGLFPNTGSGTQASFNSVDAPLWFFWTLQQYAMRSVPIAIGIKNIWKEYGDKMISILEHFRKGTLHNIYMRENYLLWAGENNVALTWMDAMIDGIPVTPRTGLAVEINALWYNAIQFALEAATASGNKKFIEEWKKYPALIEQSFKETFWDEHKNYLADVVNEDFKDWSIRPNQLIAISLPYSPVENHIAKQVLEITERELLTPRGLRTLSPNDSNYKGSYNGDQRNRDLAYHNGTVWTWLLGPFAEEYLRQHGSDGIEKIKEIRFHFEEALFEYGIGTIAEIYEGDAPHKACGAISQAWSVAELLRIKHLLKSFETSNQNKPGQKIPLKKDLENISSL